jgi:hypothetical protein
VAKGGWESLVVLGSGWTQGVDARSGCHDDEVDERNVVSKPEMLAGISLPFVEARAWLMRFTLSHFRVPETKNTFLTRSLECLETLFFVLSWTFGEYIAMWHVVAGCLRWSHK